MLKTFRYRLYPNKVQTELLNKHIGSCRFVYNLALECKTMAYNGGKINLSSFDLMKQLPDLKIECFWLKEINAQSLQQSIKNLDIAFTRFFKGQSKFPNFKKKSGKQSFNVQQRIIIENNKLYIPKFKDGIEIVLHRLIKGQIKQATINRTPTGKFFASILCETGEKNPSKCEIKEKTTIGVDLGIKTFIVTSNGQQIDNPKFLKRQLLKLKYTQRKYSKYKGKRTKNRLVKLHEKVANQRKDFLHKVSSKLIGENQTICIEDLNIRGMTQNHKLAQSINDVGWGMFVTMLQYKANWTGKNILKINRFEPSSKLCNCCGWLNNKLTLKDREWKCISCGVNHDRDFNAAINIKNIALQKIVWGTHTQNRNEPFAVAKALTSEVYLR